jgi:predicted ATPase
MSDGTLRVLGLLLAVYQAGEHSVVAIEEPESTVHPAVAESIVEVLMDAAQEKQILFTTHSPDIIDHKEITDEQIRVVTMERNETLIAPGELLRTDELNPDVSSAKQEVKQMNLFSAMEQG